MKRLFGVMARLRMGVAHALGGTFRGQSLVEFALIAPTLILIAMGALDLGRAFYIYESLENAAREGAMFGTNFPNFTDSSVSADPLNMKWHVKKQDLAATGLAVLGITDSQIAITCYSGVSASTTKACSSAQNGDTVEVKIVNYPFRPLTPVISNVVGTTVNMNVTVRTAVFSCPSSVTNC
jgi:Flp pilus assembly protein TadG